MKLHRTERINELLRSCKSTVDLHSSDIGDTWIEHRLIVSLARQNAQPLAQLLKTTFVSHHDFDELTPAPQPKTKEYVKLMKKLKDEELNRQILGTAKSKERIQISDPEITKETKEQLTAIFNILISISAVAFAFWYWCSNWEITRRILMSLFAAVITALAEVTLFGRYWSTAKPKPTPNPEPAMTKPAAVPREELNLDPRKISKISVNGDNKLKYE